MTLEEFKIRVENNSVGDGVYILMYEDSDFVPHQYLEKILEDNKDLPVEYIKDIQQTIEDVTGMFYKKTNLIIRIFRTDKFECFNKNLELLDGKNFIVCNKIDDDTKALFADCIVEFPKLESWQIADYLYSNVEGVDNKKLDYILKISKYDPYRLSMEIDKLRLYSENMRKKVFDDFLKEDVFSDMKEYTLLNLISAITSKNSEEIAKVYKDLKDISTEYMGLHALLYNNFIKIVKVWMNNNPTEQNTGMKSNQIYAINKLPRVFSKESLVKILDFLCTVDYNVKEGNLPADIASDYMVMKTLTL